MKKIFNYEEANNEIKKYEDMIKELYLKGKKEGYAIENGLLVDKKEVIVADVFFRGETEYESYGDFTFYKKIFMLEKEIKEKILSLPDDDNLIKEYFINIFEDFNIYFLFTGGIPDYGYGDLREEDITSISMGDEASENLILDIFLKSKYGNWEGYISIVKMPLEKYLMSKEHSFAINFKKVETDNLGNNSYLNVKIGSRETDTKK